MVEIWSVIILIVGIAGLFTGALFALAAANQRKPVEQLTETVKDHSNRIGYLERQDAARNKEISHILEGIESIKQMFEKHEAKG